MSAREENLPHKPQAVAKWRVERADKDGVRRSHKKLLEGQESIPENYRRAEDHPSQLL